VIEVVRIATKEKNLFCVVSVKDQAFKTDVVKKTIHPTWNQILTLDIVGISEVFTDITIMCMGDSMAGDEFLGQVTLNLRTIRENFVGKSSWFKLTSKNNTPLPNNAQIHLDFQFFQNSTTL